MEQGVGTWIERSVPFDSNDKNQFGLGRNVVGTFLLAEPSKPDLFTLCVTILLDVRFGTLEDCRTLFFASLNK